MHNELTVSYFVEYNVQNDVNILKWEEPENNNFDRIIIRRKEESEMEYSDYTILSQNCKVFIDSDLNGLIYSYEIAYILNSEDIENNNDFELLDIISHDEDLIFEDNDIENNSEYEYLIIAKRNEEEFKSEKELVNTNTYLEE